MKILKTNNFVSERVKVKPVTNAEWNSYKHSLRQGDMHSLRQGDIIYVRETPYTPRIVIMEESLYKQVLFKESLESYDFTKGVILSADNSFAYHGAWFITLAKYDMNLRLHSGNSDYDIVKVRRGYLNPIRPEDMNKQFIDVNNLAKLAKDFTVVFEDGKWL